MDAFAQALAQQAPQLVGADSEHRPPPAIGRRLKLLFEDKRHFIAELPPELSRVQV
jgi:hypothetical protein